MVGSVSFDVGGVVYLAAAALFLRAGLEIASIPRLSVVLATFATGVTFLLLLSLDLLCQFVVLFVFRRITDNDEVIPMDVQFV
jgi:hypothetical protein